MTLAPKTRLGPYEILDSLGAGGMGEVYRALDTRLGREVAVKVLPQALAKDPDRRSRFEREARAVAALSHPNVLALHDFGTENDQVFAVMELLDGETLRKRLESGPLPAQKALPVAIQIALGLACAHGKGIVHRDLKPENVMLTRDGRTIILDFGLAKMLPPETDAGLSLAPTQALATEAGMIMGTIGYMAPEQVRGLPTDARCDIFAFGSLLYEMLSGRRAFSGVSPADTLSAILREEPPGLDAAIDAVPPAVEQIMRRCLEKQPEARFHSAQDLAFALEAISTVGRIETRRHSVLEMPGRARVPRFKRLTYRSGFISGARFAPEGHSVVYGAAWEGRPIELYTSRPENPESRHFGLQPADLFAVSASGEMALSLGHRNTFWFEGFGTLARTSLSGGGVRLLAPDVGHADWSPDGKSLAIARRVGGRFRLEYPAGTPLYENDSWISQLRVSRDGSQVAFADYVLPGDLVGSLCVVDRAGKKQLLTPALTNVNGIAWSPSGEELWFSGINEEQQCGIWAVRLSGERRLLLASPTRLRLHDVSPGGQALVSAYSLQVGVNAAVGEASGETNLAWFDGSIVTDLSNDGSTLLLTEVGEAENPTYAVYMRPTDGSPAVRLGDGMGAELSPDGQWALALMLPPSPDLLLYPTGMGETRSLRSPEIEHYVWAGWHPGGQHIYFVGSAADRPRRLYRQALPGGPAERLNDVEIDLDFPNGLPISPDGARLALRKADGTAVAFAVASGEMMPLAGIEPKDVLLRFDTSGHFLFVTSPASSPPQIIRVNLETGVRTSWRRLQPADPSGIIYIGATSITPDGCSHAYSYVRGLSILYLVDGLHC